MYMFASRDLQAAQTDEWLGICRLVHPGCWMDDGRKRSVPPGHAGRRDPRGVRGPRQRRSGGEEPGRVEQPHWTLRRDRVRCGAQHLSFRAAGLG